MRKTFLYLVTISLFLLFFDQTFGLLFLHNFAQKIAEPFEIGLYQTGYTTFCAIKFLTSLPSLFAENQRLYEKEIELIKTKAKLDQTLQENKILKQQLGVAATEDFDLLPSKILGSKIEGEVEYWLMSCGLKDGVKIDQVVVFKDTLLGKIEKVGETQSLLLPIFASKSKVPAEVSKKDSKALGLVEGGYGTKLKLTQVLQEVDLELGDVVVSSGASGNFPEGLLIGEVAEIVQEDVQIFKSAELAPFWDIKDLTTVFVILE